MSDVFSLGHKVHELDEIIKTKAAELGLMFVSGPDPREFSADLACHGFIEPVNHHLRGTYLFSVSEKP